MTAGLIGYGLTAQNAFLLWGQTIVISLQFVPEKTWLGFNYQVCRHNGAWHLPDGAIRSEVDYRRLL